jgi:hypothetical protein
MAVVLAALALYNIYPFVRLFDFYLREVQIIYLKNFLVGRTGDQVHEEQRERGFGGWVEGVCDRPHVEPVFFEFFVDCVYGRSVVQPSYYYPKSPLLG